MFVISFTPRQSFPWLKPFHIHVSCNLNEFIDFNPGWCWKFWACQKTEQSGVYMHINTNQNFLLRNNSMKCKWCRWPCPVGKWEKKLHTPLSTEVIEAENIPSRLLEHLYSSSLPCRAWQRRGKNRAWKIVSFWILTYFNATVFLPVKQVLSA